jgi:hypothetical protein
VVSVGSGHRRLRWFIWVWAGLVATPVAAQTTTTATISANVGTLANLTLSSVSVSFPDADPDAVPQVSAAGGPLTITAKARATHLSQVLLTVQANGPLRSGLNTIAASAITWTSTGAGFVAGTLSSAASVTVGSWIGSGTRAGTQTLKFQNLWTYATDTYTATLTYTLSAP